MKSIQKKTREDWVVLLPVILILGVVAAVLYSAFAPFEPYTLHSYNVQPSISCMGDIVEIGVNRTLQKGTYQLDVYSYWERDDGYRLYNPVGRYVLEGTGKPSGMVVSPALQQAPEGPGEWQFVANVYVRGRVGVLPRTQIVKERGNGQLTVLPNSNPRCVPTSAVG